MPHHDGEQNGRGLSFAKRIYLPRTIGLSIGSVCVAVALYPLPWMHWIWAMLVMHAWVWPHLAYQRARRSSNPYKAELQNMLGDSFAGGIWVALMGFSALPSVAILAMMAMQNIAANGLRLLWQGLLANLLGAVLGFVLFTPQIQLASTPEEIYACLPLLVIYPAFIGWMGYKVALKLSEHKHVLSRLSRTDSLTGLINHGTWKDLLQVEFTRSQTLNRACCVALIDIDHFKTINDRYGHIVGDSVLKALSQALRDNIRASDLAGRYGGDELCVILPNTDLDLAVGILERLRQIVENQVDALLPELRISLSIGVAPYEQHIVDAASWLNEADKALYGAKSTGRNRVVSAPCTRADFQGLALGV
ncbi:diguanylate cyclase [Pseudomonas sp. LJDD11]|uniref:diguanylate cyclase n=1 Tax=Pseudomonas sp. LJDD11 TaxID=2931984 RepID=UPI00211CBA7D|nr:diguanylate cyclase [Pseudomonas sp. LJDD11]MCQ9424838.1 diguanylate cyclase [Pseudomonas sp. LJDD11]